MSVELKLIVIEDSVDVKTSWKQRIWTFVKQNLQTVFIVLKAFERFQSGNPPSKQSNCIIYILIVNCICLIYSKDDGGGPKTQYFIAKLTK